MKQLWAPWRMIYISEGAKETDCIFCSKSKQSDLREALVVAQTAHTLVMLNKYPYNNGHLLLAPKRHERNLSSLSAEEYSDLNEALRRSEAADGVDALALAQVKYFSRVVAKRADE